MNDYAAFEQFHHRSQKVLRHHMRTGGITCRVREDEWEEGIFIPR